MLPTLIRRPGPASIAAAAVLSVYFAIGLNSAMRQSLTYDEPAHWRYGMQVASGDTSRFDDSKMPVTALNTVPAAVLKAAQPRTERDIMRTVRSGRVVTLIAAVLLGWAVFAWASGIAGAGAGLIALGIFVLDPNLAAHSQFVTTDIYGALGITLAVGSFWNFLQKPGAGRALLAGMALGGALLCKFTSVYLVILFPLLAVIRRVIPVSGPERRAGLLRTSALVLIIAAVSLAVLAAGYLGNGWGAALKDYDFKSDLFIGLSDIGSLFSGIPLPFPKPFIEGLDWVKFYENSAMGRGPAYLFGEVSTEPFAGYFAWVFLFKVPLSIQALLAWTMVEWAVVRRMKPAVLWAPLTTAFFFIAYFVFFCNAQMGVRMLLPAFPAFYVFAGCVTAGMVFPDREDRWGTRAHKARIGALVLLMSWCVVSVGKHYPHLLGYFNELAGKPTRYYRILADSNLEWGNNMEFGQKYMASHWPIQPDPKDPRPGRIIISANFVTGVVKRSEFAWARWLIKHKEPVDHVGYGYLVYELTEDDIRAIRLAMAEKS
jgi:hypothetical protein